MTGFCRIGLDFDNTIVIYDQVFHRYAARNFGMPLSVPVDKSSVRQYFWAYEGGRDHWIELQGIVYGKHMEQAQLADGFRDFLNNARAQDIEFSIVSHKTRFPARGPSVSLHEVAWQWLDNQGFFDAGGLGFSRDRVFFEPDRRSKLDRIGQEKCGYFIDDLPEVLTEEKFPIETQGVLYDPHSRHRPIPGVMTCSSWWEISKKLCCSDREFDARR